ncbi:NHL domain-containing protein [Flavipsychrobacter stenotrophus]|nr:T9SS type A sorting domain-containing protein [Flavipsychrobacter stenotrophus]
MKAVQFILFILLPAVSLAQAGNLCTFAGGGTSFSNGVPAKTEYLGGGGGICKDKHGNIYYADYNYAKVYKVDAATNLVYRIAGYWGGSVSGDGGPATAAGLANPNDVAVDTAGNIYIADNSNHRIRKVDGATGIITTIAGGGASTADNVPATTASLQPFCVYLDRSGNLYTGSTDFRVRKIDLSTGLITTVAGNGTSGVSGDGGPATNASLSGAINSVAIDSAGNLYIVDMYSERVRKVTVTTGIITTVAGGGTSNLDDIPATAAQYCQLYGCSLDMAGNIFTSDACLGIHRIDAITGKIRLIAGQDTAKADCVPPLTAYVGAYRVFVDDVETKKQGSCYVYFSQFGINVGGYMVPSSIRRFMYVPGASTSVSTVQDDAYTLQIYPNPASDILHIKVDQSLFSSYSVTNIMGGELFSGSIIQNATELNIDMMPAGLYFVNLTGVNGNLVHRFVKL